MSFDINNTGTSVVITGSNDDGATNIVRIYEKNNDTWNKIGLDLQSNGNDVSISNDGKTIAITGVNNYARIYQYNIETTAWEQLGNNISTTKDTWNFYKCILNSDGTIVTFLEANDYTNQNEQASIVTFQFKFNDWYQIASSLEENIAKKTTNISSSNDGLILSIGKPYFNNNTGEVIIYKLINDNWIKQGDSIIGSAENNLFGTKISINSNGTRLAISGDNVVKVYRFNIGMWTQIGQDITGNIDENLGYDLSINSDGTIISILTNTVYDKIYSYKFDNYWTQIGSDPTIVDPTGSHTEASIKINDIGNLIYYFYKESGSYKFSVQSWPTTDTIISTTNQSNLTNKL